MTIIREAKNEDTDALEEIFLITRQKTFKLTPSQNFNIGDYKKSTEGEEVWVAEENGNIAGFISLWLPDNFIHNLFVHPDYQGRSIGQQLLKKAEERLSRPMALKVTLENIRACLFYEKHGWKKISVHENEKEPYILFGKN
jgi:ribosomal protein S18 acetylase RimI-like enzyme